MKITYDPQSNLYSIEETDNPYRSVSYSDARLWLRGDGYTPSQIRRLLLHARVLGYFTGRPLTIT
jgi:hypothetical protein